MIARCDGGDIGSDGGGLLLREIERRTEDSWSLTHGVVAKVEHLSKGTKPRFPVASSAPEEIDGQALDEAVYCARGDMENGIEARRLVLSAGRTRTAAMRTDQTRLCFSSIVYVLMHAPRRSVGTPPSSPRLGASRSARSSSCSARSCVSPSARSGGRHRRRAPARPLFAPPHANLTARPRG